MRAAWWWIDRWRKSTAYTDMRLSEQAAYRNLLDELWLRGGALPDDDRILGKICGDSSEWPSVRKVVMARFHLTPEGWRNVTHDEVATQSQAFQERQREKGRKRAESANRVGGKFEPVGNTTPAGNQPNHQPETSRTTSRTTSREHQPETSLPSPSPSPSPVSVSDSVSQEKKDSRPVGKTPSVRPARRVPADFVRTPNLHTFALTAGLSTEQVEREWEKFRDHEYAKAKTDWSAAWRNWVRTAIDRDGFGNGLTSLEVPQFDWQPEHCDRGCIHEYKKTYLREHRTAEVRPCPDAAKATG